MKFSLKKLASEHTLVALLLLGLLVLIPLNIYVFVKTQGAKNDTLNQAPSPTFIIHPTITSVISPTITVSSSENAQERLLEKIKKRAPLSQKDRDAKTKILTLLPQGERSGVLHRSSNIIIDYTYSANIFQVEILTKDVASAKNEAVLWFKNYGMSQEGICNLPLSFYLNFDVKNSMPDEERSFDPLPPGC